MPTHSKPIPIYNHSINSYYQMYESMDANQIIKDEHQFHTHSCTLLSDGIHLVHGFNGNDRTIVRCIYYFSYYCIENAGSILFYAVLLHLVLFLFNIFMVLTNYLKLRKRGSYMVQMVLASVAFKYYIYDKILFSKWYRFMIGMWYIITLFINIYILMMNKIFTQNRIGKITLWISSIGHLSYGVYCVDIHTHCVSTHTFISR
eukprot:313989_1